MTLFTIKSAMQIADAAPSLMADPNGFLQHYANFAIEKSILFVPKIILALIILWIGFSIAKRVYPLAYEENNSQSSVLIQHSEILLLAA